MAPELIGKWLVRCYDDGLVERFMIDEVEAYRGTEDLASHASRGRTTRTDIMFREGGFVYAYLIYGMYWMFNIVAGEIEEPQAALIRGVSNYDGPGKLTRRLKIDRGFYGEDLTCSERLWLEEGPFEGVIKSTPRIGIDYAGEHFKNVPWRFVLENRDIFGS
jgi:DNA-3-methyladenine glycosylase